MALQTLTAPISPSGSAASTVCLHLHPAVLRERQRFPWCRVRTERVSVEINAREVQAGRLRDTTIKFQQHIQQRRHRQISGISVLCVQAIRAWKTTSHHSNSGCLIAPAITTEVHQPRCPPPISTPIPARSTTTPTRSRRVSGTPSTIRNQTSATDT